MNIREEMSQQKLLSDTIYESIRENIINRTYQPGMKLTEKHFAEYLSVSRTPIREAIKKLSREGLVAEIPNKGAYVIEMSPQEFQDIAEALSAIEENISLKLFDLNESMISEWIIKLEMILFFIEKDANKRVDGLILETFEFLLDSIKEKYLKESVKSMDRLMKATQEERLCKMGNTTKVQFVVQILGYVDAMDLEAAISNTMKFKRQIQNIEYR